MSGFTFDDLEDLDEGATETPPPSSSFDALEDLDADDGFRPWSKPGDAGSQSVSSGSDTAGAPRWSGGSSFGDAAYSAAGGVFSGLGMNPSRLGPGVQASLQMSRERSPVAAPIGKLAGEVGAQVAALPAGIGGVATGALGGLLSGYGNTEGSGIDKLQGAGEGALMGAGAGRFGELAGNLAGKLGGLLKKKAPEYAYEQATRGLMKGGSTPTDLAAMDAQGGREAAYEASKQMKLPGAPRARQFAAKDAVAAAEAERAAIEQEAIRNGVRADPVAVGRAVGDSNPFPGVARMDRAAQRNANQVYDAANAPGGSNIGPLDVQRKYFGGTTNFASGTPNAAMGKGAHSALNGEMEDAINLAKPGAGSRWRELGQAERQAIGQGEIAKRTADQRAFTDWTPGDVATGGVSRLINANRHGIAEAGYGAASKGAAMGGGALDSLAQLPNGGGPIGARMSPEAPRPDQAVLDLMHSPSQGAELGKYQHRFAEAMGRPGEGNVQTLITELLMTDPEFRTTMLPKLMGRGGMF